jgi:hypothetical protein
MRRTGVCGRPDHLASPEVDYGVVLRPERDPSRVEVAERRVVEIFAEVSLRHVPSRAGPRAALAQAITATLADEDDYRRR